MLYPVFPFLAAFPHILYPGSILLPQSLCSLEFDSGSLVSRVSISIQSCHHGASIAVVLLLSFPLSSCPCSVGLLLPPDVFESLNLSNICNQIVTTTLPFSEGLDDCSRGFIMSSYISLAHVRVHTAPTDVGLITSTERIARVPGYWLPRHA